MKSILPSPLHMKLLIRWHKQKTTEWNSKGKGLAFKQFYEQNS